MKKNYFDVRFDFMSMRRQAMVLSIILVTLSIASLAVRQLNFGIDFTGGTLVEVSYSQTADVKKVRAALMAAGFNDPEIQPSDQLVMIRLAPQETDGDQLSKKVINALKGTGEGFDMRRIEFVGPQIGEELTEEGGLAMLITLFCILIYVALRFEYRFGVGSVTALVHDVLITLGIFSVLQYEFNLSVLAAILAVIGYSLNDTIVVFDRIRENFRKLRKGSPTEVINISLNQTLSRTIMTSFTTLLVLFALFILGGEVIHNFALALMIGVLVGTYSSIFVASPITLAMGISKRDLMPIEKEGADLAHIP